MALTYRGIPLQSAYSATKHAIEGFTELIHDDSDINVSMVHLPGLNTPQFTWTKSRLPNKPQPVPAIYLSLPAELNSPRAKLVYLFVSVTGETTVDDIQDTLDMKKISLFSILGTLSKGSRREDRQRRHAGLISLSGRSIRHWEV